MKNELAFASDGSKARKKRTVLRREIEVSGNVNDSTFVQKKAIVRSFDLTRRLSSCEQEKLHTKSERRAPFSLPDQTTFLSFFSAIDVFSRSGLPRISVISRAERSTASLVKEESIHTV